MNAAQLATAVQLPATGTYSFRLTVDDTQFHVTATTSVTLQPVYPPNQPPMVDPGPDLIASLGVAKALQGSVTDDGLPAGKPLTASWSVVSGPGSVTFANPTSPATSATFGQLGAYVLRLTASDTEWTSSADVFVDGKAVGRVQLPGVLSIPVSVGTHVYSVGSSPTVSFEMPPNGQVIFTNAPVPCP